MKQPKHPRQPIVLDEHGTPRFKANAIVQWMLEQGRAGCAFDLNTIAKQRFSREDMVQLAQLIGYSVSGFGELSYVPQEEIDAADAGADRLQGRSR
jgi:hypothetical protein